MTETSWQPICVSCGQSYELDAAACPHCGAPTGATAGVGAASIRRTWLDILLDPQAIQWLLGLGGSLLVLGLIIWLAALGVFENAWTLAGSLGAGNLLFLVAGWAILKLTRHQTSGRALTLLACLVMPLNLWFYHAQGLLTLEGHLWVAALVLCALYTVTAVVLADALFVYVLCGGLAMSGLLLLADLGRVAEILAPSTLLVVLGLVALHAERAFPEGDGPFSRRRFGMAFFRSSQVLLGAGLLLLMGAQFVGWSPLRHRLPGGPPLVVEPEYFVRTFLLTLAGAYAFLYANLVVRKVGAYFYLAAIAFAWAQMQVLFLWNVREIHFPFAFAGTALLILAFGRWASLRRPGLHSEVLDCGHALLALALTAGGLIALSHVALPEFELVRLGVDGNWRQPLQSAFRSLLTLGGLGAVAVWLTPARNWRRVLLVLLCLDALVGFALLHRASVLSPWQKIELFTVLAGVALVAAGHAGWYREGERADDMVSFNLVVGSLLALAPLTIATIDHRFGGAISFLDEGVLIGLSVLLLGTGLVLRLKSTTLIGGLALAVYLVQVMAWMSKFLHEQVLIGVYLTAGGAVLFGTGLALSLYRDRLLGLPEKIKNREGIFRVLSWR